MHVKKSEWSTSNFQNLAKKRKDIFYSSVVRMSNKIIKYNHFVNLKRMKTTENAANTNCFAK